MQRHELQSGSREYRSGETERTVRPHPDTFEGKIGEAIAFSYLRNNFPIFEHVVWNRDFEERGRERGDRRLEELGWDLDRRGLDAVDVSEGPDGKPNFLGIQFSTAKSRETWKKKFFAWERNPVVRADGLARVIGGDENDPVPVVFLSIPESEIDRAWSHDGLANWREEGAVRRAKDAARYLPRNMAFQCHLLDQMENSLHHIKDLVRSGSNNPYERQVVLSIQFHLNRLQSERERIQKHLEEQI